MKFHEARPGLVEQDIIAKMPDLLDDRSGIVDRSVVGALLDDRGTERPLAAPRFGILD